METLQDMLASQGALIESLLSENKKLQQELIEGNRKLQEVAAGSKKVQEGSGVAEDKSAAFAKLAAVKLADNKGKLNSIVYDDDLDTDFDGMSELSSRFSCDPLRCLFPRFATARRSTFSFVSSFEAIFE